MSDGADVFVGRAQQLVAEAVHRNADLVEKVSETMDRLAAEKARQTVETLDRIIQVSDTRTEKRPQTVFVMTADEPSAAAPGDVNLTINAYWDLDSITPEAHFRVRAELGMPIHCKVEWMRDEVPESGFMASAGVHPTGTPMADIVLTWVDPSEAPPGADTTGVSLAFPKDNPDGWAMLQPGVTLDVWESREVVAKVHLAKT